MPKSAKIHIGTSGWHYAHWKGPFYPDEIADDRMLSHYSLHFQTVEINNSFYRLPQKDTLALWKKTVPADFIFALKASRYITHMKKLKDPAAGVPALLEVARRLKEKLGPILFQLPPRWHVNHARLDAFLSFLPPDLNYAFEFRDPTWFTDRTYETLAGHGAAFCIYQLAGRLSPKTVTADFVYVRLHGPEDAYQGHYDKQALSGWAGAFSSWLHQGKNIYCYFDNDQAGYAPQNALALQAMLSDR